MDSSHVFRVDSIEFLQKDAFEDAVAHTLVDSMSYDLLNRLHIETKSSVVQKSLLFEKGDSVSLEGLIESERLLRAHPFLSEARILHRVDSTGRNILRVETSDHWSTNIPISLKNPSGERWEYTVGLLESNLLGYGQKLGIFFQRGAVFEQTYLLYSNPHFIFPQHRFFLQLASTTEGHANSFLLQRPFLSRARNELSWFVKGGSFEKSHYVYRPRDFRWAPTGPALDANDSAFVRPNSLYDLEERLYMAEFRAVLEDTLSFRWSRSWGKRVKWYGGAGWNWLNSRMGTRAELLRTQYAFWRTDSLYLGEAASELIGSWDKRRDSRPMLKISASAIRYLRMKNFRRVKWIEDVNEGWDFSLAAGKNIPQLGADNKQWRLEFSAASAKLWGASFFSLGGKADTYVDEDGTVDEFRGKISGDWFYRSSKSLSTVANVFTDHLLNADPYRQLTLGGAEGLAGFPHFYFAGKSRYFAEVEERWFPQVEAMTILPVFAAFANAGQVYARAEDFDWQSLQYSVGVGLRLGLTKATTGVVNHLNLSWPLNGDLQKGWRGYRFSLLAKVSL